MNKSYITAILAVASLAFSAGTMAQNVSKSEKADYKASIVKAKADYAVAKEKCNAMSGNAKDLCVKEAKSALVHAKSDAMAQLRNSKATETASVKYSEARRDTAADKRDADYAVAKENCNSISGNDKKLCLNEAASILENPHSSK